MPHTDSKLGTVADKVGMVYRRGNEETTALVGCSLNVERGRWASLIGASGCGKSTLLRIFANIVKPTSGAATLHGLSPAEARANRTFALVSQQSTMLPWRKIGDTPGDAAFHTRRTGVAQRAVVIEIDGAARDPTTGLDRLRTGKLGFGDRQASRP